MQTRKHKQTVVATLRSGGVAFKPKLIRNNKKGHYVLIKKEPVHQQDTMIVNIHGPNIGTFKPIMWT